MGAAQMGIAIVNKGKGKEEEKEKESERNEGLTKKEICSLGKNCQRMTGGGRFLADLVMT